MRDNTLGEVRDLAMWFPVKGAKSHLKAVDGIDLDLIPGETLGLVGESGCGKTTVGRTLVRLYEPTAGSFRMSSPQGERDVFSLTGAALAPFKRDVQMVFQDPYASLNPRMTVQDIIGEGLGVHRRDLSKSARSELIADSLRRVGLGAEHARRYPHEFSGGQRQRIGIARALVLQPRLIILDEPVSALDVSVQAQVVNLLEELRDDLGLTYLFIAHDLSVVKHISDRVSVMYLGQIVESAATDDLYDQPLHPYTRFLFASIPVPDPSKRAGRTRRLLQGEVPSPVDPPPGCRFASRCPEAMDCCRREDPPDIVLSQGRMVNCFLYA